MKCIVLKPSHIQGFLCNFKIERDISISLRKKWSWTPCSAWASYFRPLILIPETSGLTELNLGISFLIFLLHLCMYNMVIFEFVWNLFDSIWTYNHHSNDLKDERNFRNSMKINRNLFDSTLQPYPKLDRRDFSFRLLLISYRV